MLQQQHVRLIATAGIALAVFCVVSFIAPPTADAVPAWARKYGIQCEACHTAWPSLNAYGRDFKIAGYKIPDELEILDEYDDVISDFLAMDKSFPVSAIFKARPYDKKNGKRARIRAGHESEVIIGGSVNKNFSAWVEFEAEDEFTNFNIRLEQLTVAWNPQKEANLVMGYGPVFWADPYDTLADGGRRMTRNHKGPLSAKGAAGQRLRGNSQWVGAFGKISDRVFYTAGVSAGNNELEGDDAADFYGRVMVDVTPEIMVGGYILDGTNDTGGAIEWDFQRVGFDAQVEVGDFKAYGMYMSITDTPSNAPVDVAEFTQNLGYVEAMYVFRPSGFPMIVPVARIDFLDDYTDLTANVNFYVMQNIRAYVEYWSNISVPSGKDKNNRWVLQMELAF